MDNDWYSIADINSLLHREGMSLGSEEAEKIKKHMNLAFQKGKQMAGPQEDGLEEELIRKTDLWRESERQLKKLKRILRELSED